MPIPFSILRQSRFRFYAGNTADDYTFDIEKSQESSKKGIRKPARKKGEDRAG